MLLLLAAIGVVGLIIARRYGVVNGLRTVNRGVGIARIVRTGRPSASRSTRKRPARRVWPKVVRFSRPGWSGIKPAGPSWTHCVLALPPATSDMHALVSKTPRSSPTFLSVPPTYRCDKARHTHTPYYSPCRAFLSSCRATNRAVGPLARGRSRLPGTGPPPGHGIMKPQIHLSLL